MAVRVSSGQVEQFHEPGPLLVIVQSFLTSVLGDRRYRRYVESLGLVRKLKPGGKVYIREPISSSHGMPAAEIKALMVASGLTERDPVYGRSQMGEPTFQAVYVK